MLITRSVLGVRYLRGRAMGQEYLNGHSYTCVLAATYHINDSMEFLIVA
jgi:hypothetical protein